MSFEKLPSSPSSSKPKLPEPPLPPWKRPRAESIPELSSDELEEIGAELPKQERDVVPVFEVTGFSRMTVVATLEKKDRRKKDGTPNEDAILIDAETGLLGVLDGLGREGNGDLASQAGSNIFPSAYKQEQLRVTTESKDVINDQLIASTADIDDAEDAIAKYPGLAQKTLALARSFNTANEAVKETGGKSTACIGFIHEEPDGRWLVAASVGDSGLLKTKINGDTTILTKEDSVLNQLRGLPEETRIKYKVTDAELEALRQDPDGEVELPGVGWVDYASIKSAMTKSLGEDAEIKPSMYVERVVPGTIYQFVTDVVTDKFETHDGINGAAIAEALVGSTLKEKVNNFRKVVKDRRSEFKNDDDLADVAIQIGA